MEKFLDNKWVPLIYDFCCRGPSDNITLEYLRDNGSKYEISSGRAASLKFNELYSGSQWHIPELEESIYCPMLYLVDNGYLERHMFVFINHENIENCLKNNVAVPNRRFFKMLLGEHLRETKKCRRSSINELVDNIPNNDYRKPKYYSRNNKKSDRFKINNPKLKKIIDKTMKQVDYDVDTKVKNIPELALKLYKYQHSDVKWMLNIEKNGPRKLLYKQLDDDASVYKYSIRNIIFSKHVNYKLRKINTDVPIPITFYGGCLADEVGLGKTIDMLALSVINKPVNPKDIGYRYENRIFSGATVIVCPSQLCGQWRSEIEKNLMHKETKKYKKQKIISFITKVHLKKYSYKDLCEARYVIISFNYLKNTAYTENVHQNEYMSTIDYRKKLDEDSIKNFQKFHMEDYLEKKYTNLSMVHWHRIIFDEFHELHDISGKTLIKKAVCTMNSSFRWCVSGTPFANGEAGLYDIMLFLSGKDVNRNKIDIYEQDYSNLIRRNTKDGVSTEFRLPKIINKPIFLDFSLTERSMYNAYISNSNNSKRDVYLRKLCCHPNLANETRNFLNNCTTLKDMETNMVMYYKNLVENTKVNIKELDGQLSLQCVILGDFNPSTTKEEVYSVENEIKRLQNTIENKKNELRGHESSYNFFANVVDSIKDEQVEDCGICLDEIDKSDTGVTKCGHIYCYDCLKQVLKYSPKCPSCRTKLSNKDIFLMTYDNLKNKDIDGVNKDEMAELIDSVGTKLANLIMYLKNYKEHCIIFSQWYDLLINVGQVLDKNGIKNIFCKGTAYHRTAAIRKFNENDKYKVIMLSSSNAASGINLTKASTIIMIDPVYGEYKYRKDIEDQAIARAHRIGQKNDITVARFIIKNTVEEEIYNETVAKDIELHNDLPVPSDGQIIDIDA